MELSKKEKERRDWVNEYNKSLPQREWYDEEFEINMSMGIGGIYDSEYMEFVFNNNQSKRIKRIKRQQKKEKKTTR
jgi:hypothetical protein